MRKVTERNDKRLSFEGGSEFLRVPESFFGSFASRKMDRYFRYFQAFQRSNIFDFYYYLSIFIYEKVRFKTLEINFLLILIKLRLFVI